MAKTILPRSNIVRSFNHGRPTSRPLIPGPELPSETILAAAPEHSERILLLEDEEQTNLILKEYLQDVGYSVVAVTNGVEGLKEVMKSDFELVICDMMMPKLPGDMFYLAVQRTRPHLCNRFVFITGHQSDPTIDTFLTRTHAAILVKPFRLQQLEVTLQGVLSRFPKKVRPLAAPRRTAPSADVTQAALPEAASSAPEAPVFAETNGKLEAVPSMVVKALKIVGFMRKNSTEVPPPLPAEVARPLPSPVSTASDIPPARKTQRIPELADTPIHRPAAKAAHAPATPPTAPPPAKARGTRKIAAPKELMEQLQNKGNAARPKVTQSVRPLDNSVTLRVKRDKPPTTGSNTPKVTRSVPKTTVRINKSQATAPQVTRKVAPKATQKVSTAKPSGTRRVKPAS